MGKGEVNIRFKVKYKERKNKIPKKDQTQKDYEQQDKEMKKKSNK